MAAALKGARVAGRVTNSVDPKGQPASFVFNGVGQPLTATFVGETIAYGYGGNGRTETVTDNRGVTSIQYQTGSDRVLGVTDPVTGQISYQLDKMGNRRYMNLPGGGQWEYRYNYNQWAGGADECDRFGPAMVKLIDDEGRDVEYDTTLQGALLQVRSNRSYAGGGALVAQQVAGYTYDQGMPTSLSHGWLKCNRNYWHYQEYSQWVQRTLVQNDYTYSATGNRLTNAISDHTGPIRTEAYGYDQLSRLTSVDYGDGELQGYGFDPMGNRLSKTVNGTPEAYTYNAANMLLTRGGNTYVNDPNGNTLSGGGRNITWPGQNRMSQSWRHWGEFVP